MTLIIMVKTKGLHRALNKILGRVSGDAEEVLGRQHLHIDNGQLQLLLRMLTMWIILLTRLMITDHVDANIKGFPGGPYDTSVLTSYADHVAGREHTELKLLSHGRKVEKFGRPALKIEGIVVVIGLCSLITCSLETCDKGLLSSFVKRWHKETSTYYTFDAIDVDEAVDMLVELLEVSTQEEKDEIEQCRGAYVHLTWPRVIYRCTLFANKSATHFSVIFLDAFHDLSQSKGYSWGAAALVHMYNNLHVASKHTKKHLVGYITLLQITIRGNHVLVAGSLEGITSDDVPYDELRAFREYELISLYSEHIRWDSSIVRHQPERTIPPLLIALSLSNEEIDDKWLRFLEYLAPDACQKIAESLEHMINMRMVTVGTNAYTLTKHYLRLARGVTEQRNSYV
ncbi:hypothetical protein GmHk_20G056802 [Glycine max]|nr:hypothetical protein GmHk_20G056802 [Glycine max]